MEGEVIPGTSLRGTPRSTLLVGALGALGLRPDHVLALEAKPASPPSAARRGSRPAVEAEAPADVVVEVPPPVPGQGQVLLVDQGGAVSWVLPQHAADGSRPRAAPVTRFRVPVAPPAAYGLPGERGLIGKAVRRVLHVLTFDLLDTVAGEVGDGFASRWEENQRPHRARSFTAADYRDPKAPSLDRASLRAMAEGPALLMLHGTNSLSHTGFAALPQETVAGLNTRYGGRVFAFDHPTLSVDPLTNCQFLAGLLPDDVVLEVDVLAHSRGGLVGRVLAELAEAAGTAGKLKVRQAIFVATPSLGTPLANPDHLGKLLDGLTNLLDLVPDNPVTDSLAGIVAVVRQLAVGALKGLDGLVCMNPKMAQNAFLTRLNSPREHGAHYRALAADYEPPPNTPRGRWARDAAIDAIFGWEPNDLIVPTTSAYAWNGAQNFPITERLVLPTGRAVDHSTFWASQDAVRAITTWLSSDASALRPQPRLGPVSLTRSVDDPLDEVDERFAAGDLEGVRRAVRRLPPAELARLEAEVGEVALDSFVSRGVREPRTGIVFVLPGIMGTNLWADGGGDRDRIWLNPLRLMKGDFRRLRVPDGAKIEAGGLYRSYLPLVMALDARWEVVPAGYDWRLPLESAAESLAQRILDRSGGEAIPAHLVCHSMGGLVARMLIAKHSAVWESIDNPDDRNKGGRLVMLGTPTLGSFAIALALSGDDHLVQWLARIDWRNSRNEIAELIGTFPGAYQLLTSPDVEVEGSAHLKLYDAASWGSDAIMAVHLEAARNAHEVLSQSGFDAARMFYVAGTGHATPAAVRVDDGKPGRFSYRMTEAGDGRVTHELGIPRGADGDPVFGKDRVWYSTAKHGDLTKDSTVVGAVVDLLQTGNTARLHVSPPAPARSGRPAEERWTPAELVEPPVETDAAFARAVHSLRSPAGSRGQLRADAQAAADFAVQAWLGSTTEAEAVPVLNLRVLHASLEYSSYPVMVGHYSGDVLGGAEGHLDRKLSGLLTARQVAGRYPETLGQVLIVPTAGRPPGAVVVGLGVSGELTPTTLANAARHAALEHALAWLEDPHQLGDGTIGLSTCLLGSYGVAGLTLATAIGAIVEGVVVANVLLRSSTEDKVRIGFLEFVERYAGAAEEAAHVIRDIEARLPGALQDAMDLRPDLCLRQGEGRRPAVRTADYGAGQWHRIVVGAGQADKDGRMKLKFTSFGSRARSDELEQEVDTVLLRRMLEEAVVRPAANSSVATALFEMLFPNDIKRELAGIENIHLVVDPAAADFPWEVLSDRASSSVAGPVALQRGFLRQLSTSVRREVEPLAGMPGALVIGDPPGGAFFSRLEGARREAQEVADLLEGQGSQVERLIFPVDIPEGIDSASQIVSALMANDVRILHVAGHGHFEQRDSGPPLGGVVIGPTTYLTASTLRSMRRPPDLVFLNCCHLGSLQGKNIDDVSPDDPAFTRKRLNELAASLSLELTAMGVRAVVVAGWAVSDTAAAEFARAFYSRMLEGFPFGEAVRVARDASFAADAGSSNTWAAYQCYGDPAFRLGNHGGGPSTLPTPVSYDELQRRLEEIEVEARDADATHKQQLSRQVGDQYALAEREWPRKSRMWRAFGRAHAVLDEVEPAIAAYRRALDRQDGSSPLEAVEELADLEHRLFVELTGKGLPLADTLAAPATTSELRRTAWERLDILDRLGRSSERHALRARWHEREAALYPEEERDLSPAVSQYVEAWQLSSDDRQQRDLAVAIKARQLVALGAQLRAEDFQDLTQFLEAWRSVQPSSDFGSRLALADLVLAEHLEAIHQEGIATIVSAYHKAFSERPALEHRTKAFERINELASLVDEPRKAPLLQVIDELALGAPAPSLERWSPSSSWARGS